MYYLGSIKAVCNYAVAKLRKKTHIHNRYMHFLTQSQENRSFFDAVQNLGVFFDASSVKFYTCLGADCFCFRTHSLGEIPSSLVNVRVKTLGEENPVRTAISAILSQG